MLIDVQPDPPLPRFAVVDIETSGLSVDDNRILQVAIVLVDNGEVTDSWVSLVKPRCWFQGVGPRAVHGLSRRSLRNAHPIAVVLEEAARQLAGNVFVAHNVRFDWSFIESEAARSGVALPALRRLCTLRMSRSLDPAQELSHRLSDVCERYNVVNDRPHDALEDALATARVLPHLLEAHGVTSADDLEALYERR